MLYLVLLIVSLVVLKLSLEGRRMSFGNIRGIEYFINFNYIDFVKLFKCYSIIW